jgi:hypothetical protein
MIIIQVALGMILYDLIQFAFKVLNELARKRNWW